MNQIDAAILQYHITINQLSARLAQAAAELCAAQEKIAELTTPKMSEPKIGN